MIGAVRLVFEIPTGVVSDPRFAQPQAFEVMWLKASWRRVQGSGKFERYYIEGLLDEGTADQLARLQSAGKLGVQGSLTVTFNTDVPLPGTLFQISQHHKPSYLCVDVLVDRSPRHELKARWW